MPAFVFIIVLLLSILHCALHQHPHLHCFFIFNSKKKQTRLCEFVKVFRTASVRFAFVPAFNPCGASVPLFCGFYGVRFAHRLDFLPA
jgi:hypothetical protein